MITSNTEGDGRLFSLASVDKLYRYIGMFLNNFLAPIQVRLSTKLGQLYPWGLGDYILQGPGERSRSV